MNKKNLRKMAKFVRTIPAKHFHLSNWWYKDAKSPYNTDPLRGKCGTVGCAMGWAAKKGLFGLSTLSDSPFLSKIGYSGFYAIETIFEIDTWESAFLFGSSEYPRSRMGQPSYVAKRIETFVRTNGKNYKMKHERNKV